MGISGTLADPRPRVGSGRPGPSDRLGGGETDTLRSVWKDG